MPASLMIVCNLERVPAMDALDHSQLAFGMNLSVSWEGKDAQGNPTKPLLAEPPTDPDWRQLTPWKWSQIKFVRVQFLPDGHDLKDYIDVPVVDQGVKLITSEDPNTLGAALKKAYGDARPQDLPFTPRPGATPDGQPWPARLLHLSTFPFPIPQSLNLSLLFMVKASDLGIGTGAGDPKNGNLWAAPVINTGGPFAADRKPVPLDKAQPPVPGELIWSYDDPAIAAHLKSINLTPPVDSFVDMQEQWVRVPQSEYFEDDWQGQLESRVAEAFRLPEFFSDLIRLHVPDSPDTGLFAVGSNLAQVSRMALASVADVAGFGLVGASSSEGKSFAKRLLASMDGTVQPISLSPAQWASLEILAGTFYGNLDDWLTMLKTALPALSDSQLIKGKALEVAQTLAQFQRILDIVFASENQQNLWKLFSAQWAALLKKSAIPLGDQAKILAAFDWHASKRLFDIRAGLAISNLDRFWPDFVKSNGSAAGADPSGTALIDTCFKIYLAYYGYSRVGATPLQPGTCKLPAAAPAFSPPVTPADNLDLQNELAKKLADRASQFRPRLRPIPTPTAASGVPQGITVMLSRLEHEDRSGQRVDILEHSSGVVAFMREIGTDTNWHCLNYSEPWLGSNKLDTGSYGPALTPYRPHYRTALKQASLTYNNGSVTADSALAEPAMVGRYFDSPIDYSTAFIRFRYFGAADPKTPLPDLVKTPGLKFGRQYEFCFAALTNTGVPPASVADGSAKWRLKATLPDGVQPTGTYPTVKAPYQRKILVGPLRLAAPAPSGPPAPLRTADYPPVPNSVTPRAREYEGFAPAAGDFAPSCTSKEASAVLLSPTNWAKSGGRSQFSFDVRPPSVSWNCWDRWTSADPQTTETRLSRSKLIAAIYRNTAGRAKSIGQPDLQPDDPAVENKLWIELRPIADDGTLTAPATSGDPKWSSWSNEFAKATAGDLKSFQRGPIRFTCTISDNNEGISVDADGVQVAVKQGELYRLTICAAVKVETPIAP
jgi:hypothetical protein